MAGLVGATGFEPVPPLRPRHKFENRETLDLKTYSFSTAYKDIIGSWCGFWRFGKLAATELSTCANAVLKAIQSAGMGCFIGTSSRSTPETT